MSSGAFFAAGSQIRARCLLGRLRRPRRACSSPACIGRPTADYHRPPLPFSRAMNLAFLAPCAGIWGKAGTPLTSTYFWKSSPPDCPCRWDGIRLRDCVLNIFFEWIAAVTLTFDEKWKHLHMLFIFFLQLVSMSFSNILTWCLSNSNIFISWILKHAFRWLTTQTALHKFKWLANMPNWASWRPPLRWKTSIEDRRSTAWRCCKATGGIRVQRVRSFIAKSWNYFYNWSEIYEYLFVCKMQKSKNKTD